MFQPTLPLCPANVPCILQKNTTVTQPKPPVSIIEGTPGATLKESEHNINFNKCQFSLYPNSGSVKLIYHPEYNGAPT